MKEIIFHLEAEADLEQASDYYERKRIGLGQDFESKVKESLRRVALMPKSFPLHGTGGIRKCLVTGFPYTIFFMEFDHFVWVATVSHQKRHPQFWAGRTPD